jgi:hypothetical protein
MSSNDKEHRFGKIKGKGITIIKLPISNVSNLCYQEPGIEG